MTAKELFQSQVEDGGKQLMAVLVGIAADQADFKPVPSTMSFREHVAHLCEAYQAASAASAGLSYEWGSFKPASTEWGPLVVTLQELRAKALEAVMADEEKGAKTGSEYIVAHDYYHVGQLCLSRIALDPTWDPYSIYS